MVCQNCSKKMPDDSMFCSECGAKQEKPVNMDTSSKEKQIKYCPDCGAEIPIESCYCTECRAKQNDIPITKIQDNNRQSGRQMQLSQMTAPLTAKEQTKVKKRNKIIGFLFATVVGVCLVIGALSFFIQPSINLNEYLSVSFEGYDTVGKTVVTFDTERFERDYEKKLRAKMGKKSSGFSKYLSKEDYIGSNDTYSVTRDFLSNCVSGTADKDSGLSNGEVVTFTWSCDDERALETYGYKLKYKDVEWPVEGLEQAEIFDPFDGIDVVCSGISSDGFASIEGEASVKAAQNLQYDLDVENGLSNGDTITVTVSMYGNDPVEYCIENYGMIPSPLTKEYKVETLDRYAQSAADISEESMLEMQKQAESVFAENIQYWEEDENLKSFIYLGNYFLKKKDQDDDWGSDNELYLVYQVRVKNKYSNDGDTYDKTNNIYWYICYDDLLVDSHGAIMVDVSNYRTTKDTFTIDSGVSDVWWGTMCWEYYGYQTLDKLWQAVIASNSDSYGHEDNVDESLCSEEEEKWEQEEKVVSKDGFIFPTSTEEVIDLSDIKALSDEELRYAINELYARHGYDFKDDELKAYFEKYDWYVPSIKPEDFSMELFNDVERENVETMQMERESR